MTVESAPQCLSSYLSLASDMAAQYARHRQGIEHDPSGARMISEPRSHLLGIRRLLEKAQVELDFLLGGGKHG